MVQSAQPTSAPARGFALRSLTGALRAGGLLVLAIVSGCVQPPSLIRLDGQTMGTIWSAQFAERHDADREAILADIQTELDLVIDQMSTWMPDSVISRYNSAPADTWHVLPEAFAEVLTAALELADATDGSYDPTVGPLVEAWGFGPAGARIEPPDRDTLAAARDRVGWYALHFERDTNRLWQPGGVQLDLSSIAEGYAVDRIGRALQRHGIHDYLVEIGGELRARGERPDGLPWRIAIEQPHADASPSLVLPLRDLAIATSGDYRKFFEFQGRRYSHTIDPHTGWPVDHGLAAVTVVASDCMVAGSTATALSVMGPDRGYDHALRHGIAARLVIRDGAGFAIRDTPAFQALVDSR
jgi:thiamine biosynthesis lipoprotein